MLGLSELLLLPANTVATATAMAASVLVSVAVPLTKLPPPEKLTFAIGVLATTRPGV
jgi:hypothetical protein